MPYRRSSPKLPGSIFRLDHRKDAVQTITDDPTSAGDLPLTDDERTVLDSLFPELAGAPIVPSRNAEHRQQRLNAIFDYILDADADEQEEIIKLLEAIERLFDARRATHTAPLGG